MRADAPLADADEETCFDRFHAAKILDDAVNTVCMQKIRELTANGEYARRGTKYVFA